MKTLKRITSCKRIGCFLESEVLLLLLRRQILEAIVHQFRMAGVLRPYIWSRTHSV